MGFRDEARHRMLNHLVGNATTAAPITHVSLHTAFPASAVNEVAGGTPPYARQALVFETVAGTAAAGAIDVTNTPAFEVPAGTTVSSVGFWTAATGGTLMADADVTNETFASQGTYTLNDADLSLT